MDSVRELIRRNKYLLLLLYMPVYLTAFFIIDRLEVEHFIIHCSLDSLIPFNEWFIIPYSLWFVWFPGVAAFFMWHAIRDDCRNLGIFKDKKAAGNSLSEADYSRTAASAKMNLTEAAAETLRARADFIKLCIVMFTAMSVSLVIYVIFPNGIELREPIEHTNIAAKVVSLIRAADTPYGVCPSIHVATIVAEALVIKDSSLKVLGRGRKYFSYFITLLIMYSTMAVKQHSIVDVIAGTVLASVIYFAVCMIYKEINKRNV